MPYSSMVALLAVFVDAIGYILIAIFCMILLIISAHRNRATRPVTVVREYFDAEPLLPPAPAPKPKPTPRPVKAQPVPYMRRWGLLRKRWEADEKARWDEAFEWLDRRK
jgi:hypothetical protein